MSDGTPKSFRETLEGGDRKGFPLECLDQKPDPGECENCGATIEPVRHLLEDGWLPMPDICDECEEHRKRKKQRKQRLQRRYKNALVAADMPTRAKDDAHKDEIGLHKLIAMFVSVPPEKVGEVCGVYLFGDVGTGKTVQCCAAIIRYLRNRILDEGREMVRSRYVNTSRLLKRRRRSFDGGEPVDMYTLERCDFLVMDDLGAERGQEGEGSDWARTEFYNLLTYRYDEKKLTLLASNYAYDELESHYNYTRRTASRIWQMCGGKDGNFQSIELTTNWRKQGGRDDRS